jgi:hypothetical protein
LRDLTDFCTKTQKTWLAMQAILCFVPLKQNHVLWHSEHAWLSNIVGGRGTQREREAWPGSNHEERAPYPHTLQRKRWAIPPLLLSPAIARLLQVMATISPKFGFRLGL